MANIKVLDMHFLDDLFEMRDGYVLDFSNCSMAPFFAGELDIDIYADINAKDSTSKARLLKCLLQTADKAIVISALRGNGQRYNQTQKFGAEIREGEHCALVSA